MSYFRKASVYQKGRWQYEHSFIQIASSSIKSLSSPIIDMGAGTGLLGKNLEKLGYVVEAIEPSFSMRRLWRKEQDGLSRVWRGDALNIPQELQKSLRRKALPITIFVGNAFHWMSKPEVLNYWSTLGFVKNICLIWQVLDETDPWVSSFFSEIQYYDHQVPRFQTLQWKKCFQSKNGFTEPRRIKLPKNGVIKRLFLKEDLLNFAMSMSYVEKMSQKNRSHFFANTKEFLGKSIAKKRLWLPLKTSEFVSTKK